MYAFKINVLLWFGRGHSQFVKRFFKAKLPLLTSSMVVLYRKGFLVYIYVDNGEGYTHVLAREMA